MEIIIVIMMIETKTTDIYRLKLEIFNSRLRRFNKEEKVKRGTNSHTNETN